MLLTIFLAIVFCMAITMMLKSKIMIKCFYNQLTQLAQNFLAKLSFLLKYPINTLIGVKPFDSLLIVEIICVTTCFSERRCL